MQAETGFCFCCAWDYLERATMHLETGQYLFGVCEHLKDFGRVSAQAEANFAINVHS